MSSKISRFSVVLEGGMASQLFQWSAGLMIVLTREFHKMDLSYSVIESKRQHEGDLRQLDFGFLSSLFTHSPSGHLANLFEKSRILQTLAFLKTNSLDYRVRTSAEDLSYCSSQRRYFSSLEQNFNHKRLRGTFVSWHYVSQVERILDIELRNIIGVAKPSKQFEKFAELFEENRPLIVQVRKGDYISKKDKFGLLSDNWFLDAVLHALATVSQINSIVLITDGIDECSSLVQQLFKLDLKVSILPNYLNSAETLLLMAKGQANVISNSGFGWWGSFLSNSSQLTIYPESWTKVADLHPTNLVPQSRNWLAKSSEWI